MTIILQPEELIAITGYKRPGDQLAELQRQGFHRARRSATTGEVILERVHYNAVCAGRLPTHEPRVHAPQPRPRTKLKVVA